MREGAHVRPTLTQDYPAAAVYRPQAGEAALRKLYAHADSTVRVGMIQAANGAATGADGSSRSLNGPADLRILLVLRSLADVVLVGAQTARAESYGDITLPRDLAQAREAEGLPPTPALAIVTHTGQVPTDLSPEHTWLITTSHSPAARLSGPWASRVLLAGDKHLDPAAAIAGLHEHDLTRVLCEGGPRVASQWAESRMVDDWCVTTSPHEGVGAAVPSFDGVISHRLHGDGFRMERWRAVSA